MEGTVLDRHQRTQRRHGAENLTTDQFPERHSQEIECVEPRRAAARQPATGPAQPGGAGQTATLGAGGPHPAGGGPAGTGNRGTSSPAGPGQSRKSQPAPVVREDDVLVPVAGILDLRDGAAYLRTSGYLP